MLPLLIVYTVFGLVVGSFLNVCIYRVPRRESIVFPGSRCPACGKPVRPYDNVPLLAYVWLKGRCRSCGKPISLQYPAVEALTAAAFFACAWRWQFAPPTYVNSLFICLMIVLAFIDYQHRLLPNVITLPGLVAGIALSPFQTRDMWDDPISGFLAAVLTAAHQETALPWVSSLLGAFVGAGLLLSVAIAYQFVRHRQGLGMGDVKMMGMVGAFLGWRMVLLTIFSGSVLGSVIGMFLVLFRGGNLQSKLSFGTLLAVGAVVALFWGVDILDWYLGR